MNIGESFRMALRALAANRLRSVLAMLGIVIGVGAVIALVTTVQAATGSITSQVSSLGADLITVLPNSGAGVTFQLSDLKWLRQVVPDISADIPIISGNITAVYGSNSWSTTADGTTPNALQVQGRTLQEGTFITKQEVTDASDVAVLGQTVVEQLFPSTNPLGKTITVNGTPFLVIGVLNASGGGFGVNADDLIAMPDTTAEYLLGSSNLSGIQAEAKASNLTNLAVAQIQAVTDKRWNSTTATTVVSEAQILSSLSSISSTLSLLFGGIAGISLLVGGIGIMNIMLVTVSERTREIGVRKAVGAPRRAILAQFLVESVVLSLSGGLAGVVLGGGAALVLTNLIGAGSLSLPAILVALLFAVAVGVVFGMWPAMTASRLDPVEALYRV